MGLVATVSTGDVRTVFGLEGLAVEVGRRVDGLGRATAAYLARVRFGYSSAAVAEALGYSSTSSVTKAIARVASRLSGNARVLRRMEEQLSAGA